MYIIAVIRELTRIIYNGVTEKITCTLNKHDLNEIHVMPFVKASQSSPVFLLAHGRFSTVQLCLMQT